MARFMHDMRQLFTFKFSVGKVKAKKNGDKIPQKTKNISKAANANLNRKKKHLMNPLKFFLKHDISLP